MAAICPVELMKPILYPPCLLLSAALEYPSMGYPALQKISKILRNNYVTHNNIKIAAVSIAKKPIFIIPLYVHTGPDDSLSVALADSSG